MNSPRTQPTVGDVVDLARQFALDADASGAALRHRDRAIGRELDGLQSRPLAQLLAWLDRVRAQRGERLGDRVVALRRLGMVVLTLVGLAAGWGAAAVVFRYDGTHPVNVVHVLAVFVLLPVVFLLGFAIGLLPPRVLLRTPGAGALQEAAGLVSPGSLQRLLARRLPQESRHALTALAARGEVHRRLFGRVDRWIVIHSSQVFAVAFHVGALAGAVYLVVFSDLAFAWSTTLAADGADLQRWTDALSWPWAWAWPQARPSSELIAATRYFRLGAGAFPQAPSPAGLGGWWPFLVACMAFYGLLPRLGTLILARARLRTAIRRTFLHLPGMSELRERLNAELVETRADSPDETVATAAGDRIAETGRLESHAAVVIAWAGAAGRREAVEPWLAAEVGATVHRWHEAGGTRSLADDAQVRSAAGSADGDLVVLVKAWEPPTGDLLDFLRDLRAEAGQTRPIHVLPADADAAEMPTTAGARHVDVWRRSLAALGDPWLRLLHPGGRTA
ncbi:MAG: DUF2868 domain-containing protein [Candidatus Krumholzibacteriia bacterium]